jgi:SAM-dependent methyltransferase
MILNQLPNFNGQLILDLGCGIGDLSRDLSIRGARVIGVDAYDDLLKYARARRLKNVDFRLADLNTFYDPDIKADGIWASFTAAYFPNLSEILTNWQRHLRPGGWIALTEVDDLFGHQPISERTKTLFDRYAEESLSVSRYDFKMGRKLADYLRQTNFSLSRLFDVPDSELSFTGAAAPDVVAAWKSRFDRMVLLRDFCGTDFESLRDEFLDCLVRDDHWCTATVKCCIGIKE